MHEALQRLLEDLEDTARWKPNRFAQAEAAELRACEVIRLFGRKAEVRVIDVLAQWWDRLRAPVAGHAGDADTYTLQALISGVRAFAETRLW